MVRFGLNIDPIVLTKSQEGNFIVRDGNRRMVALTFMNNPSGCPNEHQKNRFLQIRNEHYHRGNIVPKVDCYLCGDEETLLRYIQLEHTGEMDGVGQVVHQTKAKDRLRARIAGKPSRHGQVYQWLLDHKNIIDGVHNLKLSNVDRLTKAKSNLRLLGFQEDADGIVTPYLSVEEIVCIWSCLLRKVESVSDIYHAEERNAKIMEAIEDAALLMRSGEVNGQGENIEETSHGGLPIDSAGSTSKEQSTYNSQGKSKKAAGTSPRKMAQNRSNLICSFHNVKIPVGHKKARNILLELKKISIEDYQIAGSVLLRSFLEHTLYAYCKAKNIVPGNRPNIKQILGIVVKECGSDPKIKADEKLALLYRIGNWKEIESLTTLHQCVHDDEYYLTPRELCIFYDRYDYFFSYWWREVASSE